MSNRVWKWLQENEGTYFWNLLWIWIWIWIWVWVCCFWNLSRNLNLCEIVAVFSLPLRIFSRRGHTTPATDGTPRITHRTGRRISIAILASPSSITIAIPNVTASERGRSIGNALGRRSLRTFCRMSSSCEFGSKARGNIGSSHQDNMNILCWQDAARSWSRALKVLPTR